MSIFYQFMELSATFIEGGIVLSVAGSMAHRRYSGKKHLTLLLFFTVIYTVLISCFNTLQTFSFITIGAAVIYIFLAVTILSDGSVLLKATSVILTLFFMFSVDYLLSYSIIMMIGESVDVSRGLSLIIAPGLIRSLYLATDKLLQVVIFSLCRKLYPKLRLLNNKNLTLLLIITFLTFLVMQVLAGFVISDSVLIMQAAVIFAVFFIVLSLIATIFAISVSAKHQDEKRTVELMKLSGQMMEKNYQEIHSYHEIIRQQIHDFKNHLRAIDGMLDAGSNAKKYTQNLLASSYSYANECHCGNDIIDSVINCKEAEATAKNIKFEYRISLSDTLRMEPIDICAILANQIDNAIEACAKIENSNDRRITVSISQKEAFVLFKVINTVRENPFDRNNELPTSKNNEDGLHGFGIRIIRETAEKYNGAADNSYEDGCFISSVLIVDNV